MMRFLEPYTEYLYAAMRFVAGFLFLFHGTQKLLGWPGGKGPADDPLMIFAGVVELVGGAMIAAGLLTRPVAFLASGQMAVAYFMAHAKNGFWPIVNRGELAVLYCFVFLYMATRGGGRYSVDASMRRPAARR